MKFLHSENKNFQRKTDKTFNIYIQVKYKNFTFIFKARFLSLSSFIFSSADSHVRDMFDETFKFVSIIQNDKFVKVRTKQYSTNSLSKLCSQRIGEYFINWFSVRILKFKTLKYVILYFFMINWHIRQSECSIYLLSFMTMSIIEVHSSWKQK